jgi:putative multiple sugar transport system ATP-binding protein
VTSVRANRVEGVVVTSSDLPELLGIPNRRFAIVELAITHDVLAADVNAESLLSSVASAKKESRD